MTLDDAWLVGVDLQHVFGDPASPWASAQYPRAVAATQRLLPAFAGRTVLTRFVAPAEPRGAWVPYYADWPFALVPDDDPLYALAPELADLDVPVVSAPTFGKWGPALAAAVHGAGTLVLTGVSTDCCVLSTALAAADAGVAVRVVTDGCAGATDADHHRALETMGLYAPLITLTTVAEVLG
ncbi:Nicotinamidase-related amidase [Friedmanniella luteola]|uniref:Nicotinamidase-related amidase n=1 Tax=Friedmanniella luteola TaxID=546871 RepID=A0A1H1Z6Y1_9ACTN|nr:isochorismatase family protein [Friedmanniella luteola]SDT29474.1 Nicotinamidase-related amidase [Friedmanniella luteola]